MASNEKDPVGRSSLATYQTHQVPVSFGQTGQSQPDTGQRPGLCTCTLRRTASRDEESGLRILARTSNGGLSQSARQTKTYIVVAVIRVIMVAGRTTAVVCIVVPRPATQNTAGRSSPTARIVANGDAVNPYMTPERHIKVVAFYAKIFRATFGGWWKWIG